VTRCTAAALKSTVILISSPYQGKEVDAKVQGKTILIKREDGKILKYPILKSKKTGA